MSEIVQAVSKLVNDLIAFVGNMGNDLLHIVTAFISTVVHFVSSVVHHGLHFVYQNISLIIVLALAFVGYTFYQNQNRGAIKTRSTKKLR